MLDRPLVNELVIALGGRCEGLVRCTAVPKVRTFVQSGSLNKTEGADFCVTRSVAGRDEGRKPRWHQVSPVVEA